MRPALFLHVVGIEARKRLAYRADFWVQSVAVFVSEMGLAWFLWKSLFDARGGAAVGGMGLEDTVLYYAAVVLVAKLARGPDLADEGVSNDVYEGALNRYLLYPAPYLGFKYAQNLGSLTPAAIQLALFLGVAPFLEAGEGRIGLASAAMGLVSLLVANLLYQTMAWAIAGISFWADNVWSLVVALRLISGFAGGVMLPLTALPDAAQPVVAVLPFRHCFAEPALAFLGRTDVATWASNLGIALAWAAGFALVVRAVFERGRWRYTGVGI